MQKEWGGERETTLLIGGGKVKERRWKEWKAFLFLFLPFQSRRAAVYKNFLSGSYNFIPWVPDQSAGLQNTFKLRHPALSAGNLYYRRWILLYPMPLMKAPSWQTSSFRIDVMSISCHNSSAGGTQRAPETYSAEFKGPHVQEHSLNMGTHRKAGRQSSLKTNQSSVQ